MDTNGGTPRITNTVNANAVVGQVRWAPVKSIWFLSHLLIALVGGWLYFNWTAFLVFLVFTGVTICLGHSLGMHRRLIHNSYQCPLWLEYLFVHFGVLVGMAGPYGMTHQHDLRDWAQRQKDCHPYLRHGNTLLRDGWWQLNCDLHLAHPPKFEPEERIRDDKVYRFMERTWMYQQLPWAMLLYLLGDISWVIWGISARIAISTAGHWLIGYFAHNEGQRDWHVKGAAVQGHNVRFAGFITMGESWHNNHHAFPGSAMLGIYKGQSDPGWWVLNALANLGLVWGIKLPKDLPHREELHRIETEDTIRENLKGRTTCTLLNKLGVS